MLLCMSRMRLAAASIAVVAMGGMAATADAGKIASSSYPAGCAPRDVQALVLGFLNAYNAGAVAEADRFFAPASNEDLVQDAKDGELGFQWYSVGSSVGQRLTADASNRETLATYFGQRHEQAEQLSLVSLSLNYRTWLAHGVGFVFLLRRTAADLPTPPRGKTGVTLGKGGLNCLSRTIHVWSAGGYVTTQLTSRTPRRILQCTPPRGWNPRAAQPLICVSQRPATH
jgi:hypothetical protein